MSQYQTSSSVVDASTLMEYATIAGKLIPISSEDYMKLARLASRNCFGFHIDSCEFI